MKNTSFAFVSTRACAACCLLLVVWGISLPWPLLAAEKDLPSLMEQAIYSEESKGDIDAAMKLYMQIVDDANASQKLAAQAQLRLAMCLDKKRDFAGATAAFEKLVHDFPSQKEYVALANEYLAAGLPLGPAPWPDNEEQIFLIKAPTGARAGLVSYTVTAEQVDGRNLTHFRSHVFVGSHIMSDSIVESASMKPVCSAMKLPTGGAFAMKYGVGSAEVTMPGQAQPKHIELAGPVYDNDSMVQLIRRLPLAAGYKANLKIATAVGAGTVVPVELTVTKQESVTVPAGTFDAYQVSLSVGQTYWYSADAHHYLLRFQVMGAQAELQEVRQPAPAGFATYTDQVTQCSVNLPARWLAMRREDDTERKSSTILIGDSDGVAFIMLKIMKTADFPETVRKSALDFGIAQARDGKRWNKQLDDVPADAWKQSTIDGQPAVTADMNGVTNANLPVSIEATYFIDGPYAIDVSAYTNRGELDKIRPAFTQVVSTFKRR